MSHNSSLDVVTGAFGYTGRYIARRLLVQGRRIASLTSRAQPAGLFPTTIETFPLTADIATLAERLRGVDTLYNTYWVRFAYGKVDHETAVRVSTNLFEAARQAEVRRIVHVSIAHADASSPLPYYRGKGLVEEALQATGVSHAIVRPTLVFGVEDILVNNIAWFLRHFPVFGLPGSGEYPVRPVFVDDVAKLAVRLAQDDENTTLDAVGPETYTFAQLVRLLGESVGGRARIMPMPPRLAHLATNVVSLFVRDVVLTWDEILGITGGLLTSESVPTGDTRFSQWVRENGAMLGEQYHSELNAHYRG